MYNSQYYKKHQLGSYLSAKSILSYLLTILDVSSLMDFGCGMGTWCQAALDLGVLNVSGIDNHPYDNDYMLISNDQYYEKDLRNPVFLNRKADLVISVEVGEHIESSYSKLFIENLCRHGDIILFSAALPFQGGTGHVNEKWCSCWANIFDSFDYKILDCIRPHFWEDRDIEVWYKNNCVLFVKNKIFNKISNKVNINPFPIDIVHPDMLKRILIKRNDNG